MDDQTPTPPTMDLARDLKRAGIYAMTVVALIALAGPMLVVVLSTDSAWLLLLAIAEYALAGGALARLSTTAAKAVSGRRPEGG